MPADYEDEEESPEDVKNDQWLKENYIDLIADYPNQWIAVLEQKIVAKGSAKRLVERKAKQIAGDRSFSLYFIEPSDIMP